MAKSLHHLHREGRMNRQAAVQATVRFAFPLVLGLSLLFHFQQTPAQARSAATGTASLCSRNNSIDAIRQQIDVTKTIDDPLRRIAVLTRAADLLWPFQQDKARAAFGDAFDIAVQHENEKREQSNGARSLAVLMATPDQRLVVIRAVARRDSTWSRKLTEQMLKLERQIAEQSPTRDSVNDLLISQRLLDSATQLIATDTHAALDLATASLNYPASYMLTKFLYQLAGMNQQAADQFYERALAVYANRPMREFLFLTSYPFALRDSGDTPVFGFYVVPSNLVTNLSLQRRFVQALLARAQRALEVPLDDGDNFNELSGAAHILTTLMRIEPLVARFLPDLSEAVLQTREKMLVTLPVGTQSLIQRPGRDDTPAPPVKTLDEQVESALKAPNANRRDELIAIALISSAEREDPDRLIDALSKLSDSSLRDSLREWLQFQNSQRALKNNNFDEALRLAGKVEAMQLRAYLHFLIARALLNVVETQGHGREVLDEAITEANKAGSTVFAARILLTASNLYAKLDLGRSISVLGDAINCINHLEVPDFSVGDQTLVKEIKGKSFRRVLRFYLPGLDPESAFRELAKIDFDDAMSQTSAITDKPLRALTILAVAEVCLQEAKSGLKDSNKSSKP